jgi:hypothetical protein
MISAAARLHNFRDTHRVLWQHRGRSGNRMKFENAVRHHQRGADGRRGSGAIGQPVQGQMVDAIGIPVTWQIAGAVSMTQALCYIAAGRQREPA